MAVTKHGGGQQFTQRETTYCQAMVLFGICHLPLLPRMPKCWRCTDCIKSACYGEGEGRKSAEFYAQDATAPRSDQAVCSPYGGSKRPSFGTDDGSTKAELCSQYAKTDMVNMSRKRRTQCYCTKQAKYRVDDGKKKAEFWFQHALARVVHVRSKRCAHQSWTKGASLLFLDLR